MTDVPLDPEGAALHAIAVQGGYSSPAVEAFRILDDAQRILRSGGELQCYSDIVDRTPDAAPASTFAEYRRLRGAWAITRQGLQQVMSRAMVTWPGEVPMRRDHNLLEPVSLPHDGYNFEPQGAR